jgi:uncharacterized membrane protein YfcA
MEFIVVPLAALLASALTLHSGFGLGTLLLPAFGLFFPIEVAVGMTAVVHLLNNVFKLALLGRHADRSVAVRFGAPAIAASFLGAFALLWLSRREPLVRWTLVGRPCEIEPVGFAVGVLMVGFAAWEVLPFLERVSLDPRWLPLGGLLSGFFGGLSGHQGALRSAFLVRANLGKEAFVATGIWIACAIDFARLAVYGGGALASGVGANVPLVATTTAAAFAGALVGARVLKKVTFAAVRTLVAALLFGIGILLAAGVV